METATNAELEAYVCKIFETADDDHDGVLSAKELKSLIARQPCLNLGLPVTDERVHAILTDDTRKCELGMSYQEFYSTLAPLLQQQVDASLTINRQTQEALVRQFKQLHQRAEATIVALKDQLNAQRVGANRRHTAFESELTSLQSTLESQEQELNLLQSKAQRKGSHQETFRSRRGSMHSEIDISINSSRQCMDLYEFDAQIRSELEQRIEEETAHYKDQLQRCYVNLAYRDAIDDIRDRPRCEDIAMVLDTPEQQWTALLEPEYHEQLDKALEQYSTDSTSNVLELGRARRRSSLQKMESLSTIEQLIEAKQQAVSALTRSRRSEVDFGIQLNAARAREQALEEQLETVNASIQERLEAQQNTWQTERQAMLDKQAELQQRVEELEAAKNTASTETKLGLARLISMNDNELREQSLVLTEQLNQAKTALKDREQEVHTFKDKHDKLLDKVRRQETQICRLEVQLAEAKQSSRVAQSAKEDGSFAEMRRELEVSDARQRELENRLHDAHKDLNHSVRCVKDLEAQVQDMKAAGAAMEHMNIELQDELEQLQQAHAEQLQELEEKWRSAEDGAQAIAHELCSVIMEEQDENVEDLESVLTSERSSSCSSLRTAFALRLPALPPSKARLSFDFDFDNTSMEHQDVFEAPDKRLRRHSRVSRSSNLDTIDEHTQQPMSMFGNSESTSSRLIQAYSCVERALAARDYAIARLGRRQRQLQDNYNTVVTELHTIRPLVMKYKRLLLAQRHHARRQRDVQVSALLRQPPTSKILQGVTLSGANISELLI
eukprot:TRINITY_DN9800_c0_g1_i1.p1 TRINITY_DN9800_c0_g1~~TRINITY_DN9800_c0_g1_i1.p1  ORF type:complete len:784 (+),score=187.09 TRINITY_DN9800_c0_g1_i1:43-2394(+)